MARFQVSDIEPEVFADLLDELQELYEGCERNLIELEHKPNDTELLKSLFRAVHTIKGDLGLLSISPLIQFLGHLEDGLSLLRDGKLTFTPVLSDLLLLSLEKVNAFIKECHETGEFQYDEKQLHRVEHLLSKINKNNPEQHEPIIRTALLTLEPTLVLTDGSQADEPQVTPPDESRPEDDLAFFKQLIEPVEARSRYWRGRSVRQLKLALLINRYAGSAVDERQLTCGCYVHDFGMGFMPLEVLHKQGELSSKEVQLIHTHVYCSAKLLENMSYWHEAKMMVLQHHEKCDGSGYPLGLKDHEISDGAKILAIVDTFDAMTHERASQSHMRRPYQRAVAEINRLAGTQLSPYWVAAFNQAMQALLSQES
ncbi:MULTISPECIES: HD-GYP domain-containing protein [Gammaproteobacteria]|uniref:HD-GYP domain-containing protein n=1 Tax=Gammaproteobacteria TaxID=1236 RepID=UPI000DCFA7D3|nr:MULTISPECIES: HD domain-containing phosphohydrolase [Gammaproteobacteria]RTE87688.1 HD domain-containing protein [Aliidiomarina sp. B3213]TCZ92528.1 HD domain-containing protein [Lysobacter sp. N42]